MELVPRLNPTYQQPQHLARLVDLLERIRRREPVRAVCSVPPRHGKTDTILAGLVGMMLADPTTQIAYAAYNASLARSQSRKCRRLAGLAGVELAEDANRLDEWRTTSGNGGLVACGKGGSLTGQGFHAVIVDDPFKDRVEAESAHQRELCWEWFNDVVFTRLEPDGAILVNHTRWHVDDLAGRLIERGWENVTIPALDDDNRPLWPARYDLEKLAEIRDQLGQYGWQSLYQQRPYARGGQVFQDVRTCASTDLPAGARYAIGFDLAYSTKTKSDYSVAVLMAEKAGTFYLLEVLRMQSRAEEFAVALGQLAKRQPGCKVFGYLAGTEQGTLDLIRQHVRRAESAPPKGDKLTRAQPVAAAWNTGKVLVVLDTEQDDNGEQTAVEPSWFGPLLDELQALPNGKHDDQVDALAAAFDALGGVRLGNVNRAAAPTAHNHPFGSNWTQRGAW